MGLILYYSMNNSISDPTGDTSATVTRGDFTVGADGVTGGAAEFDGIGSCIKIDGGDIGFGKNPFTISLWAKLSGDGSYSLLEKYDRGTHTGFSLYTSCHSGGYSGEGNAKYLRFSVNSGCPDIWRDCGKPAATNTIITCMTVFEGRLYAGSGDDVNPADTCKVYRYDGDNRWSDCGRLGTDPATLSVYSMIVHNGCLYAATGAWNWDKATAGTNGGRRIFRYEGGRIWHDCGGLPDGWRVLCLASYEGDLYAGNDRGTVYKFNGCGDWQSVGRVGESRRVYCMGVWKGRLYAGSQGSAYRYEGGTMWTCIADGEYGVTQVHKIYNYDGSLIIGTWPHGRVLRYVADHVWENMGDLGIATDVYQINEVNDLSFFGGDLYAGVIPLSEVWRYKADGDWSVAGTFARDEKFDGRDIRSWARVPSMCEYGGRLYIGTSTCHGDASQNPPEKAGRVYSLEAGKCVAYEHDLGDRWHHIALTRDTEKLKLYIDGAEVSETDCGCLDLTCGAPLTIGGGLRGFMRGAVDELRIYDEALDSERIKSLYRFSN